MSRRKGTLGILRELEITDWPINFGYSWLWEILQHDASQRIRNRAACAGHFFTDGKLMSQRKRLRTAEAFGNAASEWHFKFLVLVGLYHKQNPEDEGDQADQAVKRRRHSERAEAASEHHPRTESDAQHDVQDMEAAKCDDRLRSVESYKGALVDQIKNDSRDPTEHVTHASGNIFGQAGL
jgi:hypothetical protein